MMTGLYTMASKSRRDGTGSAPLAESLADKDEPEWISFRDLRKARYQRQQQLQSQAQTRENRSNNRNGAQHNSQSFHLDAERPPRGGVGSSFSNSVDGAPGFPPRPRQGTTNKSDRLPSYGGSAAIGIMQQQWPASPSDFPILFGDAIAGVDSASVHSGISQQQLLRKKARSKSVRREEQPKKIGRKKKREHKIVILPPELTQQQQPLPPLLQKPQATVTTHMEKDPQFQYREQYSIEEFMPAGSIHFRENEERPLPLRSTSASKHYPVNSCGSTDDKESATAESTVTDNYNGRGEGTWSHAAGGDRKDYDDGCSVESFPILSSKSLGSMRTRSHNSGPLIFTHDEEEGAPRQGADPQQNSVSSSVRNVRFSERLEHSAVFLSDENADAFYSIHHSGSTEPTTDSSSPSLPSYCPPQLQQQQQQQPTESPKSILRESKYTTRKPNDQKTPLRIYRYSSSSTNSSSTSQEQQDVRLQRQPDELLRQQQSSQSHRQQDSLDWSYGSPIFLDNGGAELSPIRKTNTSVDRDSRREVPYQRHADEDEEGDPWSGNGHYNPQNEDDDMYIEASRLAFIEAVAAVVIQTAYRRHSARQMYLYLRHKKKRVHQQPLFQVANNKRQHSFDEREAARIRQTELAEERRGHFAAASSHGNNEPPSDEVHDEAATMIQAVFRGFWARDCLKVDHYCATVIQKTFRRFSCHLLYRYKQFCAITIQAAWRRSIAREHVSYLLAYAILIQSVARGYLIRKFMRPIQQQRLLSFYEAHAAATTMQSIWRMHFCWSRYNRLLSALVIQSVVRGWLVRKYMARMGYRRGSAVSRDSSNRHKSSIFRDRDMQNSFSQPQPDRNYGTPSTSPVSRAAVHETSVFARNLPSRRGSATSGGVSRGTRPSGHLANTILANTARDSLTAGRSLEMRHGYHGGANDFEFFTEERPHRMHLPQRGGYAELIDDGSREETDERNWNARREESSKFPVPTNHHQVGRSSTQVLKPSLHSTSDYASPTYRSMGSPSIGLARQRFSNDPPRATKGSSSQSPGSMASRKSLDARKESGEWVSSVSEKRGLFENVAAGNQ